MADKFLYEELDSFSRFGGLKKDIPDYLKDNLNSKFELRPYQEEAFGRFFHCLDNDYPGKERPLHFLFNMATGSGKTLIMAGLILYLYEKGYRNILFFVDSTNTIEKTRDNFLNPQSMKYLFKESMVIGSRRVVIAPVVNFEGVNPEEINICFTTIQKLHSDLSAEKENAITYEDFKDKRIVLLADEAHHINVGTKSGKELFDSWENTVERIFRQHEDNLLLEFTATMDYTQKNIVEKYRHKAIYRYDLREFRNDRYAKDVHIVQSDFADRERILQALILSQYKQEVAGRHRINLKPVILFKAQKTIAQSKENKDNFHKLIDNLRAADIEKIQKKSKINLVNRAFKFFQAHGITPGQLAARLKAEFAENHCLSVNEEKEKERQQLLLNSLEERNNPIRALFAVQKLNEGWDVLNLFDIVRCYEGRDGKGIKPGKTTISEAQLIGRGARYFPFVTGDETERFRRKYDKELDNELRILEELHYHSVNDSRYISELRTALIEQGMVDEREVTRELKLKEDFKASDFYKHGIIYINERLKKDYSRVTSFKDFGVSKKNIDCQISSGEGRTETIFDEKPKETKQGVYRGKDISISKIRENIIRAALAKRPFFNFSNIKRYFPNLESMDDFIRYEQYLGGLEITFKGDELRLSDIPNEDYLRGAGDMMDVIEDEIKRNITEYEGSRNFKNGDIKEIFYDKQLKLRKDDERASGDEEFVRQKGWYAFNANYGTSEEKAFVRMFDRQVEELKGKYQGIYLVRNEQHFKIYNFTDGKGFEPDFVLFLIEENGDILTYQIFIEPKGKHLKEYDKWKEKFLEEIRNEYRGKTFTWTTGRGRQKYKILGVPLYNNEDENQFKQSLKEALL